MKIFYQKIIFLIILAFLAITLSNNMAIAQTSEYDPSLMGKFDTTASKGGYDTEKKYESSLRDVIANIVRIFLGFLGVVFISLTIYAGYLWMSASGNEEKVTKAKDILKNSIIGLAIVLAAYGITVAIMAYFESATSGIGGGGGSWSP